jgi:hypothetical protein
MSLVMDVRLKGGKTALNVLLTTTDMLTTTSATPYALPNTLVQLSPKTANHAMTPARPVETEPLQIALPVTRTTFSLIIISAEGFAEMELW